MTFFYIDHLLMKWMTLWVSLLVLVFSPNTRGEELPVETFFRDYKYREVRISPDGQYVAALAPTKKHQGLAVVDLKSHTAGWAYGDRNADVSWYEWANTNRLIFGLATNGYRVPGLMAVNRDGTQITQLLPVGVSGSGFLSRLPNHPGEILVTSLNFSTRDPETGWGFANVERLNLFSCHMTREVTNPGHVVQWMTDHQGIVRVGVSWEQDRFDVLYRAGTNAPWQKIAKFNFGEDPIEPMGFDADNQTLLVRNCGDARTEGLYTYDLEAKKLKQLAFRHAEVDVEAAIFSRKGRMLGVAYETDRPQIYWFDRAYAGLQASLDKALPGSFNEIINMSDDLARMVVLARSDRSPGTYYLFDRDTSKLEKIAEPTEWIKPEQMCEMKPIEYRSRDGLTIHGYLTLPKDRSGKNLPLIVNPHGGPTVRDSWGFDPEVQFFANRGYAVLQMNFRGSTGYGWEFTKAGFKQWGLKQQDDITDGVRWAVAQGIADPKRICIYGASYGGYATLIGLEQTPELYRCGISYAGVTDIIQFINNLEDLNRVKAAAAARIGDPKAEREKLKLISPLEHADKVQVPVLLAYGRCDPKVPIESGKDMANALKKTGKLYDMILKDNEGHGFHKEENRIELWTKIDEFLKANMN